MSINGSQNTCSICYDTISPNQEISSHKEGQSDSHEFHQECLSKWFEHNFSCPMCRASGDVFEKKQSIFSKKKFTDLTKMAIWVLGTLWTIHQLKQDVNSIAQSVF